MSRRLLLIVLIALAVSGCVASRGVRLCGIRSLSPANECVLEFYGDSRTGRITRSGAMLVPRGVFPSPPPPKTLRQIETDERCSREALCAQQEHYRRTGEHVPYAPIEARCKRRSGHRPEVDGRHHARPARVLRGARRPAGVTRAQASVRARPAAVAGNTVEGSEGEVR